MGVAGLDCPGMAEGLDPDQEEEDVALRDASMEIPAAVVVVLALSAWEFSDGRGRARYQDLTLAPRFLSRIAVHKLGHFPKHVTLGASGD
jgi:hypothetical protein